MGASLILIYEFVSDMYLVGTSKLLVLHLVKATILPCILRDQLNS